MGTIKKENNSIEDSILSIGLKQLLATSIKILPKEVPWITSCWQDIQNQIDTLNVCLHDPDLSEFNPLLNLGEDLIIPEISYKQINRHVASKRTTPKEAYKYLKKTKGQGKSNQETTHEYRESIEKNSKTESQLTQGSTSLYQGNQARKKVSTEKEYSEKNPVEGTENQYFKKIQDKFTKSTSSKHITNRKDNLTIPASAFQSYIYGQKAPVSLLNYYKNITELHITEVLNKGKLSGTVMSNLKFGLAKDQLQLNDLDDSLYRNELFQLADKDESLQDEELSRLEDVEDSVRHKTITRRTEKETKNNSTKFEKSPKYQGLRLLEKMVSNWTGLNCIDKDILRTKDSTLQDTVFPGSKSDENVLKDNFKNYINLNVQLQGNSSDDENLEEIAEQVNRILMEQARRYGIDLT